MIAAKVTDRYAVRRVIAIHRNINKALLPGYYNLKRYA